MKKSKQKILEAAGWKVSDTQEFLGLSQEEMRLIEIKRVLVKMVREKRSSNEITHLTLQK